MNHKPELVKRAAKALHEASGDGSTPGTRCPICADAEEAGPFTGGVPWEKLSKEQQEAHEPFVEAVLTARDEAVRW